MSDSYTTIGRLDNKSLAHLFVVAGEIKSLCGAATISAATLDEIRDNSPEVSCFGCRRVMAEQAQATLPGSAVKTTGTPGSPVDMLTTKLKFVMNEALKEYFVSEMSVDQKAQHIANLEIALAELKAKLQGWKVGHQSYLDTLTDAERHERMKLDQAYRVTVPKPKTRIEKKADEVGINLEKFEKFLGGDLSDLYD